jgi:hypothetical protein
MKLSNLFMSAVLIGSLFALGGCATTGVNTSNAGPGVLYHDTTEAVTATGVDGSKMGKSCASNILGIAATGDSSISAAKNRGGVSKVSTVDVSYFRILSLYGKTCTIVHGQ